MAIKRLYVSRDRLDEVVDGIELALSKSRVGSGTDATVTMGPLHARSQRDFVQRLCDEARASGAEVRQHGTLVDETPVTGNHMLPALVLTSDPNLGIVSEEQFGPALPVIPFDNEQEGVAMANDTWSGLCSSVWSADQEHALRIARQLRAGVTFINDHGNRAVDERAPLGGRNQSGIGRELGREGMLAFTESHVISETDV
jgi:acyl-CoA reductase-like NAD-dependent aldehyde dehydrogenase